MNKRIRKKHLWCATHVKCPKCNKIWAAVYPILARRLECPKCGEYVRTKR